MDAACVIPPERLREIGEREATLEAARQVPLRQYPEDSQKAVEGVVIEAQVSAGIDVDDTSVPLFTYAAELFHRRGERCDFELQKLC